MATCCDVTGVCGAMRHRDYRSAHAQSFAELSQSMAGFSTKVETNGRNAGPQSANRRDARLDFLGVEDQQVGTATGEFRRVGSCRLAFFAAESRLDVGHAV